MSSSKLINYSNLRTVVERIDMLIPKSNATTVNAGLMGSDDKIALENVTSKLATQLTVSFNNDGSADYKFADGTIFFSIPKAGDY